MTVEGLGGDGHIRSFSSIFPDAPLDTLGPRAPYCVIFVWGGMSTRTLRQKYQPPSSQPFCPRSHHLRAPQPCPCLDTSSLCSRWDRGCRGQCLWSPASGENCQGGQGGM